MDEEKQPVKLAMVSVDIPIIEETLTGMAAEMKLDGGGNLFGSASGTCLTLMLLLQWNT